VCGVDIEIPLSRVDVMRDEADTLMEYLIEKVYRGKKELLYYDSVKNYYKYVITLKLDFTKINIST